MSGSLNKVMLIGRLGKDPETKTFQDGGKVVTLSVATSERWTDKKSREPREKTQWTNISIWNETLGEVATRYLKKGAQVYLEGQLETRSWEKDGETRYATEVVLRPFNSDLQMLDKAPDRPDSAPGQRRDGPGPSGAR